jgi:hypothetical protein
MRKCLFILLCALAGTPTADAYTVIVLYTTHQGPQHEGFEYEHHGKATRTVVEKRALEGAGLEGAIGPKIVLSTGKPGYFAIATSKEQNGTIVGWSGPLSSAEAATKEAAANCKKRGGTNPRIKVQWSDGMSGQKK